MVINRVRVLGSGPHTPTKFFGEYPPPSRAFQVSTKMSTAFAIVCDWITDCLLSIYYHQQEIINPDSSNVWKTIHSQVRLIHVNTSQAVKVFRLHPVRKFLLKAILLQFNRNTRQHDFLLEYFLKYILEATCFRVSIKL